MLRGGVVSTEVIITKVQVSVGGKQLIIWKYVFYSRIIFYQVLIFRQDYSSTFNVKHRVDRRKAHFIFAQWRVLFIENTNDAYHKPELVMWDTYQSGPVSLAKTIPAFSFDDILALYLYYHKILIMTHSLAVNLKF